MVDELSALNLENLGRPVAARSNVSAIMTEAHAADNACVRETVDEVDVQDPASSGVEDCEPICAFSLEVLRDIVRIQVSKCVANIQVVLLWRSTELAMLARRRSRPRYLRGPRVRSCVVLLRCCRSRRPSWRCPSTRSR